MKRFACPYCTSSEGYYRVEQARLIRHFSWKGVELHKDIDEVTYVGTKLKCIRCQEVVTSFVKGVHRELDNE
jgi:hypothetical protein